MNWIIFVIVYLLIDSMRIFLDNYISDVYYKGKGSASQKIFHGAIQVAVALVALLFAGPSLLDAPWLTLLLLFLSGFIVSFGGIPYYKALELDDSTNLGIFMQLSPVLYLILGWLFLGQSISPIQFGAFAIIVAAPILILKTTNRRSKKLKLHALFYAFLYVLITVVSNLIFVKESGSGLNFLTQFAIFFLGKGASSLIVIPCNKKWRKRFRYVMRRYPRKIPRLLLTNSTLGILADIVYRMALATAPSVAIASAASDSVEPIVIFFMGIILTVLAPKFGREKLGKKSVMVHLGATVLVVIGVALIQF